MDIKQKRKELLKMDDRSLCDRILAFPDREKLNRDEEGKRRTHPSAEMAVRAKKAMEKDPEYKISEKQRFAMANSFATYSTDELKVAGITFAKADPNMLFKNPISTEGVKTVYEMQYHLVPEPENERDKNAVAVYVANITTDDIKLIPELENDKNREVIAANGNERTMTRIGYIPAAYVAEHPIIHPMTAKGTLTDHSNGHFKTISYTIDMDTEALEKIISANRNPDMYTYRMPFILNGEVKEGAGQYLNDQRDWTQLLNNEFECWGVNGQANKVYFEFPGGRAGNVIVESPSKLNGDAIQVCGSYFRYSLESGISGDLKRDGYVDVPLNQAAINTRERTYFSLQAEPQTEEDDFTKAVDGLTNNTDQQQL